MMARKHSQILRTIPFLIAVCFLALPAQAKYSGGSGTAEAPYRIATAQESISIGCDPNLWGALVPPSEHWVFSEPISRQTKLVTVEVTVVDADNKPAAYANVLAYCEPWDFTKQGNTDASGQWHVVGPIGDWNFLATTPWKWPNGILAALGRIAITADTIVTLTGTTPVQVAFVNPDGSSFGPAGQGDRWLWFTPTNFPSPVGFMGASGGLVEGKTSWLTTPEVSGILTLMRCPEEQTPGYIVFEDFPTNPLTNLVVDGEKLGCIRFQLDGLHTGETWRYFYFDPLNNEAGYHWVHNPMVPYNGGTYEIRVTPGLYQVTTGVCLRQADGSLTYGGKWVPVILSVEPNSVHELHFGGMFEARLNVMRWDPGYVHLWVDILDNRGNYLADIQGTATLKLKRGGQVLFEGLVVDSNGRYVGFGNPLADDMRLGEPVEYEYQFSSHVLGTLATSGVLSPEKQIHREAQLVAQSPHFTLHSPHPAPSADEVLQLLECAYDWLVREYSGPFSPQSMERFDVLCGSAAGGGGSSGDQFGTDLYSGYYMTGDADQMGMLYHEFVHACLSCFLGQLSKQGIIVRESINELSDPQSNLIATYLAKAIHGERTCRMYRQLHTNQFFNYVMGMGGMDEGDRGLFPMYYIDARYGQAVNRDFFRAVYANERNLGAILETMDFLKTESERTATLYSYLANDNLAWLYRWAGFQVSDEIVNQGAAYLKAQVGK